MKALQLPKVVDSISYGLILFSIVLVIVDTHNVSPEVRRLLHWFEIATYLAFSVEYVVRIRLAMTKRGWKSYVFSFWGMVDILAIIPFYLPLMVSIDSRFLRVLRLLRVVNIVKAGRHSRAINTLLKVIRSVSTEVSVTLFASVVTVVFAGMLMYYAEHDAQPEVFSNLTQSIWWAVATLTTIGYGDIYPITALGKLIASLLAFVGIGLVAIPAGLISAAYIEELKTRKE